MNTPLLKWPTITVTESDKNILNRIKVQKGLLQNIESKDLLLLAASLAVAKNIPPSPSEGKRESDITHQSLLNQESYSEFRQYIALIYYSTEGDHNLAEMGDPKRMVGAFIDYAHRGLVYLENNYLAEGNFDDLMLADLIALVKDKKVVA